MEKTKHLLIQVKGLLKSYEKISLSTGENFNIFSVMRMESNEVKTHSAIIGELLNPKGSHGQKDIFLKLFIQVCKKNDVFLNISTNDAVTKIEESVGKVNNEGTEGGRIDILVHDNKKQAFVIENKIYAPEQNNQIVRYNKAFPDAPIFYLTLKGDAPTSADGLIENKHYFIISYEKHILIWLEECLKEAVKFPMLREVINQYINLIKKLTHQTINNDLKMEIIDLIKNNFAEAQQIKNNYDNAKLEVVEDFWTKLEEKLKENLKEWQIEKNEDNTLGKNYKYLLINQESNADASFYFRYQIKEGNLDIGIISDPNHLKIMSGNDIFKEVKKIEATFNYSGLKSGQLSIIGQPFNIPNIYETDILNEIAQNSDNKINEFMENIIEYIESNKEYYKKVLNYLENQIK
jgi:hypothetical protein